MAGNRQGYRGYVSSRGFGGTYIPVPLQSLTIRDYCSRNKLLYKLHLNENQFPHSYMVLEGMVLNLDGLEGILMCSMFMLPEKAERRAKIYEHIFNQGAELRFVMEDLVATKISDLEQVEEILSIYNTLKLCPQAVPDDAVAAQ